MTWGFIGEISQQWSWCLFLAHGSVSRDTHGCMHRRHTRNTNQSPHPWKIFPVLLFVVKTPPSPTPKTHWSVLHRSSFLQKKCCPRNRVECSLRRLASSLSAASLRPILGVVWTNSLFSFLWLTSISFHGRRPLCVSTPWTAPFRSWLSDLLFLLTGTFSPSLPLCWSDSSSFFRHHCKLLCQGCLSDSRQD